MRNRITKLILLAVCVMAMTASPAIAQDDPYRTNGENVAGTLQGGGGGSGGGDDGAVAGTVSDTGGSLPFTGLDIALILGVGGVLLAVGLGTRRLTRRPDAA
jgi:hypothetical protein